MPVPTRQRAEQAAGAQWRDRLRRPGRRWIRAGFFDFDLNQEVFTSRRRAPRPNGASPESRAPWVWSRLMADRSERPRPGANGGGTLP
jgi:hypothetical protein